MAYFFILIFIFLTLKKDGQLDVLPNSLKRLWSRVMVENIQLMGNSSDGHSCSHMNECVWDVYQA